jgi:hypothetical protein
MRPIGLGLTACIGLAIGSVGLHARIPAPPAAMQADTSLSAVLTKAADYVRDYRDQLTYVLAVERSTQTLKARYVNGGEQNLDLAGDIYFVYLPADKVWMAVRDVQEVDGHDIATHGDARALINDGKTGAARALKDRNAKFNLGSIVRNFNEPTLALEVLEDSHRSRFTFTKLRERGNKVTLAYVEIKAPTLIVNTNGRPAMSRGELTVDASTGRVERATLNIRLGNVDAVLDTTYTMDAKLSMMVPSSFEETYDQVGVKNPEHIKVQSKYSNFSRFDVSTRIK